MRAIGIVVAAIAVAATVAVVRSRTDASKGSAGTAGVGVAQVEVASLRLPEMDCAGCELGVKIAANKVDGVRDVKTDSDKRTAEVTFDPLKTNAHAIADAITKDTGFKTEVTTASKSKT
jgi:copper chaperone CopZ